MFFSSSRSPGLNSSNSNTVNKYMFFLIVFLLILVVILAAILFIKDSEKSEIDSGPQEISSQLNSTASLSTSKETTAESIILKKENESQEQCLERANNLNIDQLSAEFIKLEHSSSLKIEDNYILPPGVHRYYYVTRLIMKYYNCQLNEALLNGDDDKYNKIYNQSKEYLDNIILDADKEYLKFDYMDYITNDSFYYDLVYADLDKACPDKLEDMCVNARTRNSSILPAYENWCSNICEQLYLYDQNRDKFNEEIVNSSNWEENMSLKPQYLWRARVAYRFGGKESALKVCDNIPLTVKYRDYCLRIVANDNVRGMNCNDAFNELAQILCAE